MLPRKTLQGQNKRQKTSASAKNPEVIASETDGGSVVYGQSGASGGLTRSYINVSIEAGYASD